MAGLFTYRGKWERSPKAKSRDIKKTLLSLDEEQLDMMLALNALGLWTDTMAAAIVPKFDSSVYNEMIEESSLIESNQIQEEACDEEEEADCFPESVRRFVPKVCAFLSEKDNGEDITLRQEMCAKANEFFPLYLKKMSNTATKITCMKLLANCIICLTTDATEMSAQYKRNLKIFESLIVNTGYRSILEAFTKRALEQAGEDSVPYAFFSYKLSSEFNKYLYLEGSEDDDGKNSLDEASSQLQMAFDKLYSLAGETHPDVVYALDDLVQTMTEIDRPDQDIFEIEKRYMRLCQKVYGVFHPKTAKAMYNVALRLNKVGTEDEAISFWEETLSVYRKVYGNSHEETLDVLSEMIDSLLQFDRDTDVQRLMDREIALQMEVLKTYKDNPDSIDAATLQEILNMGAEMDSWININLEERAALRRKIAKKVREHQQETLKICNALIVAERTDTLDVIAQMVENLELAGKNKQAAALQKKRISLRQKLYGEKKTDIMNDVEWLADILERGGEPEKADRLREQLIEIKKEKAHVRQGIDVALGQAAKGSMNMYEEYVKDSPEFAGLAVDAKNAFEDFCKQRINNENERLDALDDLLDTLEKAGKVKEAETVRQEILAIYRRRKENAESKEDADEAASMIAFYEAPPKNK